MIIKFKTLAVYPNEPGLDVHYYTDAYPAGRVLHVTLYPDPVPTGQDLTDYIVMQAPAAWLALQARPPADLSWVALNVERADDTDAVLARVAAKAGQLTPKVL